MKDQISADGPIGNDGHPDAPLARSSTSAGTRRSTAAMFEAQGYFPEDARNMAHEYDDWRPER